LCEVLMVTVFYDGKCGLCSKEINYYREIAPSGIFNWQDITQSQHELNSEGISLSEGLKILHAKDENGNIYKGVDAFILIWKQLTWWRILAVIISLPVIHHIANFVYHRFATWRFARLAHCQLALKQDN